MRSIKPQWIRYLIVLFWLAMMGWFVRYEGYPQFFTDTFGGYRDVLAEGQLFVDSWTRLLFKDKPIGVSHTAVEVADDDPLAHYRIGNRTLLNINVMGEPQQISAVSGGTLDVLYRLQNFEFSLTSRRYSLRIEGERREGDTFIVRVKSDLGDRVSEIEIPEDVILYSPLTEMNMSGLKPGESLRVRTLDPATMSISDVAVKALRRETLTLSGRSHDALVLSVAYQGVELLTWMDSDGRMLRQETPMGWVLEACTAQEAMSLKLDADATEDMLRATAVPCEGPIHDPASLRELRLRLTGAPVDGLALESPRQDVILASNSVAEVVLRPAVWPEGAGSGQTTPEDLKATPFIQSDHPDLIRRAARITDGAVGERDKARAIFEWVFRNVRKEPAASLPSALDVLHRLEGDCNEHTYLFVGLARAAGLPARIRVGLVYKDGVFYYHAWPAVFAGGWVEMDPTFGQELADATHVGLIEGEVANHLRLFSLLGRLKAEVVGQR
jgi:hypothetical protein